MYKKSYTEMSSMTVPEIARYCRQNKSWKYSTGISHGALLILISNAIKQTTHVVFWFLLRHAAR